MSPPDGIAVETAWAGPSLPRQTEESCDLHADCMRVARESLPALADIREARRGEVDTDEIDRFNHARRRFLALLGAGAGAALSGAVLATPARADTALDIQILQTASSLEAVAVHLYGLVLGEGPDGAAAPAAVALAGLPNVAAFARETRRRHAEHRKGFQLQTQALGGRVQDAAHPRFLSLVSGADLGTPQKLVEVAATIEKVATDTYLLNLAQLQDVRTKAILAGVMAVEAQHLATMRAVGALLPAAQALALLVQPSDLSAVPSAIGQATFPDALHAVGGPELIADPTSGALR